MWRPCSHGPVGRSLAKTCDLHDRPQAGGYRISSGPMKSALANPLRLIDMSAAILGCNEIVDLAERVFIFSGASVWVCRQQRCEYVALRHDATGFRRHETRRHHRRDSRSYLSQVGARLEVRGPANGRAESWVALGRLSLCRRDRSCTTG